MAKMILTLNTLVTSLTLYIVCIYKFMSQAIKSSVKSTGYTPSHLKTYVTKLEMAAKQVKVDQRSSLVQIMMS